MAGRTLDGGSAFGNSNRYNNRIKTLYNWAVAYTTRDQALRMIFRSGNRENRTDSRPLMKEERAYPQS